jgi:Predicted hydrolases or acyltransferases (alpha/beta hydrolase superfamily)
MNTEMKKVKFFGLLCLSAILLVSLAISTHFGFAGAQNNTSMQPQGTQPMSTANRTNIVLVHGFWADGSSWDKVIPILQNAGHKVIAVQLPLHSLADDVATTKRAVEQLDGPTILVGHSYGGFVITNAAYNNSNVTGLVYVAAFAPNEGQSLGDFFDVSKLPKDFLKTDSGGFAYINPDLFHDMFAQDVDLAQADIMATTQKPPSLSILPEKSGPPAWKQLPTWYEVSGNDRMIPPDVERMFAKQINATTITVNASHVPFISHPDQIAGLILNATKGK